MKIIKLINMGNSAIKGDYNIIYSGEACNNQITLLSKKK